MAEPPAPTTQEQAYNLNEAYRYLSEGINYNLRSKPGYISLSSEYSAAVDAFQRAGMDRGLAVQYAKQQWEKAITSGAGYQQPQVIQQMIQQGILAKVGETPKYPTPEQLTGVQRAALGLQNIRTTAEGGYYNVQTGAYQTPQGQMMSIAQSKLLERTQFVQPTSIQQQEIQARIVQVPQQPSYITSAPKITKLTPAEMEAKFPGKIGYLKGDNIFYTGKETTLAHELGHYYVPSLANATQEQLSKISKEGRIVLGIKYWDWAGGMKEYTPDKYSSEALAIASAWLKAGGIKAVTIKAVMPNTVKFIQQQTAKIISPVPTTAAQVSEEYQPTVTHVSDLGASLVQAREQFKEAAGIREGVKTTEQIIYEKPLTYVETAGKYVEGVGYKLIEPYLEKIEKRVIGERKEVPVKKIITTETITPTQVITETITEPIEQKGLIGRYKEYAAKQIQKIPSEQRAIIKEALTPNIAGIKITDISTGAGKLIEKEHQFIQKSDYVGYTLKGVEGLGYQVYKDISIAAEGEVLLSFIPRTAIGQVGAMYRDLGVSQTLIGTEQLPILKLSPESTAVTAETLTFAGASLVPGVSEAMWFGPYAETFVKKGGAETIKYAVVEEPLQTLALVGYGVVKGYQYLNEPIITKSIPQKTRTTYLEKQYAKIEEDTMKNLGKYEMKTIVTPPEIEISTRLREWMGEKIKISEGLFGKKIPAVSPLRELAPIGKERVYLTKMPYYSEVGKDFYVFEAGPRLKQISKISGTGEIIDINLYPKKLTPIQKMLVEDLSKTTQESLVPKMFKKSDIIQTGEISRKLEFQAPRLEVVSDYTFAKGRYKVLTEKIGKRTVTSAYVAKAREISTKETFPFEVYTGEIKLKDVTKPFARATGKVEEMTGITFRLKEPILFEEEIWGRGRFYPKEIFKQEKVILKTEGYAGGELPVKILKAEVPKSAIIDFDKAMVGKVSEIKSRAISMIDLEKSELKSMPKVIPKQAKVVIYSKEFKDLLQPSVKVSKAPFSALKTEISINNISPAFVSVQKLSSMIEEPSQRFMFKPSLSEREVNLQMPRLMERTQVKEIQKMQEKLLEKNLVKEIQKMQQKQIQKQQSKMQEKLLQKQIQKQITKEIMTTSKTPQKQFINRIIKIPLAFKGEEKRRKRDLGLTGFDVFKILKGKPKLVMRGVTREAGLDIGTKEVLKNLRATFFLKKSDLTPRDIATGGEFRRYKRLFREPTKKSRLRKYSDDVFVQKASRTGMYGGRLSFRGEKKEIQSARLNKLMRSIA